MKYSSYESEYLIELLKAALKGLPVSAPEKEIDWKSFVSLSKKQQVYSIIAPVLSDVSMPEEQRKELMLYNKNELVRLIAMKNELDEIKQGLSELGVEFMLVKGSVIRDYYPKQKMRQMSDIDILYKAEKQEKLVSYMKSKGYYLKTSQANSDDFFKKPFYAFEFHRQIFDENDEFHPDFDLWKRATADSTNPYEYHINREDIFIYSLCHMYDHYSISGCGIRFVCDLYVLLNAFDNLDWDYINKTTAQFGFKSFCDTAIGLARAVFADCEETLKQQELLDFILSGGVYGLSKSISEIIETKYGGSKLRYIIHRIFPSKAQMKGNYLELRKRPYLLPLFYIVRIFQKLKYDGNYIKKEIKSLKRNGG